MSGTGSPYITCVSEGFFIISGAYFIHRAVPLVGKVRGIRSMNSEELACAVIAMSIAIMAFSSLNIGGLSPARVVSIIFILGAARYGKEVAGAIAGIAAGFTMTASSTDMVFIIGAYAVGGLAAGIFSKVGKIGTASAFILANGVVILSNGFQGPVLTELYEVMAGTVIFLALPRSFGVRMSELFSPAPSMPRVDGLRKSMVMRLRFASGALKDVSETVEEVSKRLKRINAPELDQVFERVENEACSHCGLRVYCFESSRAETLQSFMAMTKTIRSEGKLDTENLPEELSKRCAHMNEVVQSVYKNFTDYLQRESAERRISEVQTVVSDQFSGISDMLFDMAEEFETSERYDNDSADRVDTALRAVGLMASDIGCCIDKYGRMTIEICADKSGKSRVNKSVLLNELNTACERKFDTPCVSDAGQNILITLTEKANLRIDFGVSQFASGENRMCGDAYEYFLDGKGRAVLIISDGMGNGGRASVDGAMAAGLISRLVKAGFGFDCSLKIMNTAMLYKSSDESLATVDIACVDLFSGHVDFLKAGAPESIVRKNGKIGKALCSSLPAGILRDIGFDRTDAMLMKDDIILLLSDGATAEGVEWISQELLNWKNGTAQQLSEHIATMAKRRRSDGREDDITVMAAILENEF